MARLAGGRRFGARRGALAPSAMRATSTAASTSSSRRAAAWRRTSRDWGVERVACQPLGVDTRGVPARGARRRRGARGAAGRDDARVLVYAGRFAPEKHLDVLADAVAPARRAVRAARVGAGPAPPPAGERVVVAAVRRLGERARDGARQRRRLRPRRRPGDLRPVGARSDGVRHAGRRARRRRPRRARRRAAPAIAVAGGTGADFAAAIDCALRRRPRRSVARGAAARRGERLGAASCPASLGHYLRLLGEARAPPAADAASGAGRGAAAMSADATRASACCIVLHDVAPSTRSACVRTLAAIARRRRRRAGDDPRRAALSRRGADAPRSRPGSAIALRRGDELALHGCTHRDDGTPRRLARRPAPQRATRAARASSGRSRAGEALARIDVGIDWFAKNGWPLSGFVAPAWLLGPGAREALVERPFEYTATLRQLVHLPDQTPVTSQSVVYSTSNAWRRASSLAWNAVVAVAERDNRLLRLELHPRDADFAAVRALLAEASSSARCGAGSRRRSPSSCAARGRATARRSGRRRCAATSAGSRRSAAER